MLETLVYVKTPKGIEEVSKRSHGLPQRARLVLIMMDGKCTYGDIVTRFPGGEGEALVATLVNGGFVATLQPSAPKAPSQGKPVDQIEPPKNDAERFEMARNLMRNTVNAFLGGMGSGLINQLDKCTTLEELRQHYSAWQEAIHLTGEGRFC